MPSGAGCWSRPAPRSGTMSVSHQCRSVGCWCAIRPTSTGRAAFLSTDLDATPAMILGWCVSRWRGENHLKRFVLTSESRPRVRYRHPAYHPGAAGTVLADHYLGRWSGMRRRFACVQPPGTASRDQHSATQSPRCAACFGALRICDVPATRRCYRNFVTGQVG
jgi:hypothetical protein